MSATISKITYKAPKAVYSNEFTEWVNDKFAPIEGQDSRYYIDEEEWKEEFKKMPAAFRKKYTSIHKELEDVEFSTW